MDRLTDWKWEPVVRALMCLRGISVINAMTLVAEIGDIDRFNNPRQLMSYLGLVPSEHSSGSKRYQGAITKAGNGAARRALVEAAHHYRIPPRVSPILRQRQHGQTRADPADRLEGPTTIACTTSGFECPEKETGRGRHCAGPRAVRLCLGHCQGGAKSNPVQPNPTGGQNLSAQTRIEI